MSLRPSVPSRRHAPLTSACAPHVGMCLSCRHVPLRLDVISPIRHDRFMRPGLGGFLSASFGIHGMRLAGRNGIALFSACAFRKMLHDATRRHVTARSAAQEQLASPSAPHSPSHSESIVRSLSGSLDGDSRSPTDKTKIQA